MPIGDHRAARLRAHRLTAPAASVVAAADHLLATQSQEFWGGRWALAVRAAGDPPLAAVDAAFDRGELVRTWTQRGTLHIVRPADVEWMLSLTADRQRRQATQVHRSRGIDDEVIARAARLVEGALRGGGRLTRRELFDVLDGGGVGTTDLRGSSLLQALSLDRVVVQGPVVTRSGAPSREQYWVLAEEWIAHSASPPDPLAEAFARFVASHGPAGIRDFSWWAGLPLGDARRAAEAASDRLVEVEDGSWIAPAAPETADADPTGADPPEVFALPPFEEFYLSYADRSAVCAPEFLSAVGPSMNGIVKPILVARGEVVGVWSHSVAVGRHTAPPVPQLFAPGAASAAGIDAALERFRRFITG